MRGILLFLMLVISGYGVEKSIINRTWTAKTGAKLDAELVSFNTQSVVLKTKNNKTTSISINKLSEYDRLFVIGLEKASVPKGAIDGVYLTSDYFNIEGAESVGVYIDTRKITPRNTNPRDPIAPDPLGAGRDDPFANDIGDDPFANAPKSNLKERKSPFSGIAYSRFSDTADPFAVVSPPDKNKSRLVDPSTIEEITTYKFGRLNGLYKEFYTNGQKKREGNYINSNPKKIIDEDPFASRESVQHGPWLFWDETGTIIKKTIFSYGEIVSGSEISWNRKGEVVERVNSDEDDQQNFRDWTSISGTKINASLVSSTNMEVVLKPKDKEKSIRLSKSKLSKYDQYFLKGLEKPNPPNDAVNLEDEFGWGLYTRYRDKLFSGIGYYKSKVRDIMNISTYKNGVQIYEKTFNDKGQKITEGSYKIKKTKSDDSFAGSGLRKVRHDLWIGWDKSGKIISARSYRYGEILFEERWNAKGELIYKDGKYLANESNQIANTNDGIKDDSEIDPFIDKVVPNANANKDFEKKPKPSSEGDFIFTKTGDFITIKNYVGNDTKVVIPDKINNIPVTVIGERAFDKQSKLTHIVLPKGLINIGRFAFINCQSLNDVVIPEGVKIIDYQAFYDCFSLTNISIPSTVNTIGDAAFHLCPFTEITIPASVNKIGRHAFKLCKNLKTINFLGSPPDTGVEIFHACSPIIYRKPGSKGWGETWEGRPVKLIK